jgi:hypothetical protein
VLKVVTFLTVLCLAGIASTAQTVPPEPKAKGSDSLKFADASNFSEGLAAAKMDLWGFINPKGEWVILPSLMKRLSFETVSRSSQKMTHGITSIPTPASSAQTFGSGHTRRRRLTRVELHCCRRLYKFVERGRGFSRGLRDEKGWEAEFAVV